MNSRRNRSSIPLTICGAIVAVLLAIPASASAGRPGKSTEARLPTDNAVRLQIRISEAKKRPDSVRYYKSAARCRKKERGNPCFIFP